MITHEQLIQNFYYHDGALYWKTRGKGRNVGDKAGKKVANDRTVITFQGRRYYSYRLIWLYHKGFYPSKYLDHIDGNHTNDLIENLRECTLSENQQNRKINKNNSSGYTGVTKKRNKWLARINVNGKHHGLGVYDTPEQAHDAYLEAKKIHHPFNPVPR